jgi:copper chaperone NosL
MREKGMRGTAFVLPIVTSLLLLAVCLLAACSRGPAPKPPPFEFNREHACSVCGMIIVDFPGSKAQIHYKRGRPDAFCSTLDMFLFYLQPDRPGNIEVIYVNDMGKPDPEHQPEHPQGHWIDAQKAFYVYGGDVMGPMGELLIPFSERRDAESYSVKHGGRIVKFDEVTADLLRPKVQQ